MSRSVPALTKNIPTVSGLLGINANTQESPTTPGCRCRYRGFATQEVGGVAALLIRVREGSATGKILDIISAPISGNVDSTYMESGIEVFGDIYVEVVTGTPNGTIRYN